MIDATIIRAHACSAGYGKDSQADQALGRSRGGVTGKIHAFMDALGSGLTAGQRYTITQAEPLTGGLSETTPIAGKGDDSALFFEMLEKKAAAC
jgi:hypothetical protein